MLLACAADSALDLLEKPVFDVASWLMLIFAGGLNTTGFRSLSWKATCIREASSSGFEVSQMTASVDRRGTKDRFDTEGHLESG